MVKVLIFTDNSILLNVVGQLLKKNGYHTSILPHQKFSSYWKDVKTSQIRDQVSTYSTYASSRSKLEISPLTTVVFVKLSTFLQRVEQQENQPKKANNYIIGISQQSDFPMLGKAMKLGIDDFIKVPCHTSEVLAKVKLIEKETDNNQSSLSAITNASNTEFKDIIQVGNMRLERDNYQLFIGTRQIKLTKTEFKIMYYLLQNKHRIVNKGELLSQVWQIKDPPTENTLDSHLYHIRKKLPNKNMLRTIHNLGIKLEFGGKDQAGVLQQHQLKFDF